jgi:hypothetical protein
MCLGKEASRRARQQCGQTGKARLVGLQPTWGTEEHEEGNIGNCHITFMYSIEMNYY